MIHPIGEPKMSGYIKQSRRMVQATACLMLLAGCAAAHPMIYGASTATDDPSEAAWVDIPEGPMRIVVSPEASRLYVLHDSGPRGYLVILDGKTQTLLHRIPVGRRPISMAIEGEMAYVADFLSDDLTVINLKTAEAVKTIPVGRRPIRVASSAGSPYLLAANYGSDSVSIIDRRSLKIVKTLSSGRRPGDLVIHPDGRHAYVLDRGAGDLSVIEMTSLEIVRRIPVGEFPSGIAISKDGRSLFVSDAQSNTLQVLDVDADNLTAIRTIPVGRRPVEVLRSADAEFIYVLNGESKTVSVIDPVKHETILTIPLEQTPRCMSATSDGGRLYISYGEHSGGISVVEMTPPPSLQFHSLPAIQAER